MPKYPPLPTMQCDPNCGECCGPVNCTEGEYQAITEYASNHGIEPVDQGITCPWYQDGVCKVHPVRPAICRMFGHVERLRCCKGYNVNMSSALVRKWHAKLKNATRWLHESLEGWTPDRLIHDLEESANG